MSVQKITLGGVTMKLRKVLGTEERGLDDGSLERRAVELGAHSGEKEGAHLLAHWEQRESGLVVPARRRLLILCVGWRHDDRPRDIAGLVIDGKGRLTQHWFWVDGHWFDDAWLLEPFGDSQP